MSHSISWDNEDKTVVLQSYDAGAVKDDLYEMAQQSAHMLSQHEHTIHIIIDERNVEYALNSADMAYLEKRLPKNQGAVVVIPKPNSALYKSIVQEMGKRIAPHAFGATYFVDSVAEARKLLQENFGARYSSPISEAD